MGHDNYSNSSRRNGNRNDKIDFERIRHDLERFNSLPELIALEYVREAEVNPVQHGACLHCRPERTGPDLILRPVMLCVMCDYIYIRGYPSAVIVKRSRGKQVTPDDVMLYHTILAESKNKVGLGRGNKPEDEVFRERMEAWRKSAILWWTRAGGPRQVGVKQ